MEHGGHGVSTGQGIVGMVIGFAYVLYNYIKGHVIDSATHILERVENVTTDPRLPVIYIEHTSYLEQGVLWCIGIALAAGTVLVQYVVKQHLKDEGSRVYKIANWLTKITR